MPGQLINTYTSAAVALEIAGSRATVALVDSHGRVHHRLYAKTLWGRPAIATLQPYLRAVDAMFSYAAAGGLSVSGLGVSIPGTLDETARRPLLIPALPSLNDFPLGELLEARYEVPTRLYVDVDAAALGEYQFGAGKGFRRVLYLTVNAVVGAALILDGKIKQPVEQYTGHICHMLVSTGGPRCSCGKRGCINTLISIDAMQKMVQRAVRRDEQSTLISRLSNREYFSPQLLAEEALRGDSVALQVYGEVGRWLSAATSKYINIFEPGVLILGGSVLSTSEILLTSVRNTLLTSSASRVCSKVEVLPAQLGADAALIGAAAALFTVNIVK